MVNNKCVKEFCKIVRSIMDCKFNKVKALVFYGPTNTGKSLLFLPLTEFFECGTILRISDNSAFAYVNLLDRTVGLMEEPRIIAQTVEDVKQLFRGEIFEVHVKYSQPEMLERLTIMVTINEFLGIRIAEVDAVALE